MANDSYTQQALAADPKFQTRLRSIISNVAWQIIGENQSVPYHDEREVYARQVITQLDLYARQFAPWLTARPALFSKETTYNFPASAVVTAATDQEISAQLLSDWNDVAGIPAPVSSPPAGAFAFPAATFAQPLMMPPMIDPKERNS